MCFRNCSPRQKKTANYLQGWVVFDQLLQKWPDKLDRWRITGCVDRKFCFRRQPSSPALQVVRSHDLLPHAHRQTLLVSAVLASVSSSLVHNAVLVAQAGVLSALLNGPLEESFASFAGSANETTNRRK